MRTCTIEGCKNKYRYKGMCSKHILRSNPKMIASKREYDRRYNARRPRHSRPQSDLDRFKRMKTAIKRRGYKQELTQEQYLNLVSAKSCHYCNGPLSKWGHNLDRLDCQKGYVVENLVACCPFCNVLKSSLLTPEELKAVVALLRQMRGGIVWSQSSKVGFVLKVVKSDAEATVYG